MSTSEKKSKKNLVVVELVASNSSSVTVERPDHIKGLAELVGVYEQHSIADTKPISMALKIFATLLRRRADLIICSEYRRSFLVNLFLILFRRKSLHLVYGMNLSAKPITSSLPPLKWLANRIFHRTSRIVVHSIREVELFSRLHNLPRSRFIFAHWGYDLPSDESRMFSNTEKPYVCMIGRNNRDLVTFAAAVRLAKVRGIAIISSRTEVEPEMEDVLEIHRNLALADCIDCIRNAAANVTLLRDDQRGAGHITVVTALHLGVPQIHSDTEVLKEYLPFTFLSRPVPIGNANAVADAIRTALEQEPPDWPEKRRALAKRWLSHDQASNRERDIILALIEGRELPLTETQWDDWLSHEGGAVSAGLNAACSE